MLSCLQNTWFERLRYFTHPCIISKILWLLLLQHLFIAIPPLHLFYWVIVQQAGQFWWETTTNYWLWNSWINLQRLPWIGQFWTPAMRNANVKFNLSKKKRYLFVVYTKFGILQKLKERQFCLSDQPFVCVLSQSHLPHSMLFQIIMFWKFFA